MLKRWSALIISLAIVASISACGGKTDSQANVSGTGKVLVSVTFDALKEFTEAVGGDKVEVSVIIPDGTEPHDFEPKAKDLIGLNKAQIFVYNGFGMEAWVDQAIGAADNKSLIPVEASKGVDPIINTDASQTSEHGQYDPHIWLSLKGAETETQNIRDGLVKADPSNKDFYEKNCSDFVAQLESLFSEYNTKFQTASSKNFVSGHAAFAYLCRDFGLTQNSVEDVFAEGEPTAQKLTELIDYCKANHVKTIFVEDMVSPAVSQALANEVGADVQKIHTIESSEENISYLDRMKDNLKEIYDSMA